MTNEECFIELVDQGKFRITDNGEIYRIFKHGYERRAEHINTGGYYRISFFYNGKTKSCYAHRIIRILYIFTNEVFPDYPMHHIDNNKQNNNINNLLPMDASAHCSVKEKNDEQCKLLNRLRVFKSQLSPEQLKTVYSQRKVKVC